MTLDRHSQLRNLADECNETRFHLEDAIEALRDGDTTRVINLLDAAVDSATDSLAAIKEFRCSDEPHIFGSSKQAMKDDPLTADEQHELDTTGHIE